MARIHEQIANARKDFLHKASAFTVQHFDVICVEDLAVKNMVKNHSLAKSISDTGWSMYLDFTGYKSAWYGRNLEKVQRFYPSSKTCAECGWINQGLRLDQREWTCPQCLTLHYRDLNAVVYPRIVSTDLDDLICKIPLVSPSSTSQGREADPLRGVPRPLRVECA